MTKKAIEIQFNWIMVVVAGALIFLLFFGVINWIIASSNANSAAKTANYLDSMMGSVSISPDTKAQATIPSETISFQCRQGTSTYRVGSFSGAWQIDNKVVFAPSRIEKGKLRIISRGFEAPFKVMNLLYVSSPQIRYVIVADSSNAIADRIMGLLDEEEWFRADRIKPGDVVEDTNNYKVRFIYVDVSTEDEHVNPFRERAAADVTALVIESQTGGKYGLRFYKKTNPGVANTRWVSGKESFAYGEALLLGAVFSEDVRDYECNRDKAVLRLNFLAEIYSKRVEIILDKSLRPDCKNLLDTAKNNLDGIKGITNLQDLPSKAADLENDNNLLQRQSCKTLVY